MKENARLIAARVIAEVTDGKSLSDSLARHLPELSEARDRAFAQTLSYGTCRFYTRLDILLSYLLKKALPEKASDVHALLLVGLYQLSVMQLASHAAVSETVNAAKMLDKPWANGLVNGVLRNYLRKQQGLNASLQEEEEAKYSHSKWWITKIKKAWPQEWHKILKNNNTQAPLCIRVNRQKISRDAYLKLLHEHKLAAEILAGTQDGILLKEAVPVTELPKFDEGFCSVQDGAAQLAAPLLNVQSGQRVLDACAAPGGKLVHLWELQPQAEYVAVEQDEARSARIHENLRRAEAKAEVIVADATDTKSWWDGNLFDRILLDAPCSASGVIRRHPDIKLLRNPKDIQQLSQQQRELLTSLWALLKPKGLLLYVTCSIFPEENEQVIADFVAAFADAKVKKINLPVGEAQQNGWQILPGKEEMDGFYFSLLQKQA